MGYNWFLFALGDDLNGLVDDKSSEKAQVIMEVGERERERAKESTEHCTCKGMTFRPAVCTFAAVSSCHVKC